MNVSQDQHAQAVRQHRRKDMEIKGSVEFEVPVTLHRIPCSCGWVGVWYASQESAENSWQRHFFQRRRESA